tara:strand:- start:4773 stop:7694 length:2922 start_codon:yes stop_codon:yes gene_type:complete
MAQDDLIDLDVLLDEELERQANPPPIGQDLNLNLDFDLLSQYGYTQPDKLPPVPIGGGVGSQIVAAGGSRFFNQRAIQDAIFKGLEAGDDRFLAPQYVDLLPRGDRLGKLIDIDYTGGPGFEVEKDVGFLPGSLRTPTNIQRVLQKYYKDKFNIPRTYDYDVDVDPTGSGFTFMNPETGKREPVNAPGMQLADLAVFAEPLTAEIPAAVAGAFAGTVGGPAGPAVTSVAAEAIASFAWRYSNLSYLKEKYPTIFPEEFNIAGRALADAGLVALFGGSAETAFALVRAMSRATGAVPVSRDAFMAGYKKILDEGDLDPKQLTVPQIEAVGKTELGDTITMPITRFKERGLRAMAESGDDPELQKLYQDQIDISQQKVDDVLAGENVNAAPVTGPERVKTGEEIKELVFKNIEKQKAPIRQRYEDFKIQADNAFRQLNAGELSPPEAGKIIKDQLISLKEAREELIDNTYMDLAKKNTNVEFNLGGNFKKLVAKELKNEQSLMMSDRELVRTLKETLEKLETNPKLNYADFNANLKRIRKLKDQYILKNKDAEVLFGLEEELINVRSRAFKNAKVKLNEIEAVEKDYAKYVSEFTQGTISSILKAADDKAGYDKFMNQLLATSNTGDDFTRALLSDIGFAEGVSAIKNGIKFAYREAVLKEGEEFVPKTRTSHDEFMRKYGRIIDQFFDEAEKEQFENAGNFARKFQLEQAREKELLQQIDSRNIIAVDIMRSAEPEFIFKNLWGPGNISKNVAIKEVFDEFPESTVAVRYKNLIGADMMSKISNPDGLISSSKLNKYLDEYGDVLEVWFDKGFTKTMRNVADQIEPFELYTKSGGSAGEANMYASRALQQLARAYVGLFTMPGRFLTAFRQILEGTTQKRQTELLKDPNALARVIERGDFFDNPAVRQLIRTLGKTQYRQDIFEDLPSGVDMEEPDKDKISEQLVERSLQLNMKKGGAIQTQMIPLKYNFGERS